MFTSGKVPRQFLLRSNTRVSGYLLCILVCSLEFVVSLPLQLVPCLVEILKKCEVQESSLTGVGVIKLAEEMGACVRQN